MCFGNQAISSGNNPFLHFVSFFCQFHQLICFPIVFPIICVVKTEDIDHGGGTVQNFPVDAGYMGVSEYTVFVLWRPLEVRKDSQNLASWLSQVLISSAYQNIISNTFVSIWKQLNHQMQLRNQVLIKKNKRGKLVLLKQTLFSKYYLILNQCRLMLMFG